MPTDTVDLHAIEAEFGVSLPRCYMRFLTNFPSKLKEPCIKGRPDLGAPCDEWALEDVPAIIELNREFWDFWPEMEFNENGRPFPRNRLLIGSLDGDLLAINTRSVAFCRVLVYKHEYGWWLPYAFSLWHLTLRLSAKRE